MAIDVKKNSSNELQDPKYFVVSETKNKQIFYPKTMHQRRGSRSVWILLFFIFICFFGVYFVNDSLSLSFEGISYGVLTLILCEIFYRCILLFDEWSNHFTSRYSNDYIMLFQHVFTISNFWVSLVLFMFSLVSVVIFFMLNGFNNISNLNVMSTLLIFLGMNFLRKIIYLEKGPIYNSFKIEENDGLNIGSGLAYSFYYGYFKLILPKSGKEDRNLAEEIDIYSDQHGVFFPIKKLIILIPKSCFCHVSLMNENFPNIEECPSLGEKKQTVAGVQKRVYKNSVYRIYNKERTKNFCVALEYATPCKTFREAFLSNNPHSDFYRKHKDEIVLQFYLTLKELVMNDPTMMNHIELIYFDDKDENERFRDVAEIITSRIKRLANQERKMK